MSRLLGPDGKPLPPAPTSDTEEMLLRAYDKLCADVAAGVYGDDKEARVRDLRRSMGLEAPFQSPFSGLAAWLP